LTANNFNQIFKLEFPGNKIYNLRLENYTFFE
jgi:hypothetical protein